MGIIMACIAGGLAGVGILCIINAIALGIKQQIKKFWDKIDRIIYLEATRTRAKIERVEDQLSERLSKLENKKRSK